MFCGIWGPSAGSPPAKSTGGLKKREDDGTGMSAVGVVAMPEAVGGNLSYSTANMDDAVTGGMAVIHLRRLCPRRLGFGERLSGACVLFAVLGLRKCA